MGLPEPPEAGASALPQGTFEGQTVIVTGGGTGLGKAMAVEFARLGAAVAILSRKEEHRAAGVAAVEAVGARALGVNCDIRQPDAVAAAFDALESALGPPGVLVNNAAGNFPVPAEDMSPNAWRTVVDIVLNGSFHCAREFARRHIAAGAPGSIINIGASYAWTGGPSSDSRVSKAVATAWGWRTSQATPRARAPTASTAATPAARCSSFRLSTATAAPRRANSTAMAFPRPVPPPVTMTVSPSKVPLGSAEVPDSGGSGRPMVRSPRLVAQTRRSFTDAARFRQINRAVIVCALEDAR